MSNKPKKAILLFFLFFLPTLLIAGDINNSPDSIVYDSAMVVQSKCLKDNMGDCRTTAAVYLWEKKKGKTIDYAVNQIIHGFNNECPFIILLGDADHKGIYVIEANGSDAAPPTNIRIVFVPYKGKTG